ncbi:MAG: hypothetical protein A2Y65_10115 [Deltaproteobacteria bacterium RBG_13_52_11]|nr:MAG: hypothetical protein A2Y65_10115 [Deltaproteobacteria bacterium RBG_13_52_11]
MNRENKNGIPEPEKDPIELKHYVWILIFSCCAGFIGGFMAERLPEISVKFALSAGLALSFSGVVLMVLSRKWKQFSLPTVLKGWLNNCGWIALILGLILQTVGIWFN